MSSICATAADTPDQGSRPAPFCSGDEAGKHAGPFASQSSSRPHIDKDTLAPPLPPGASPLASASSGAAVSESAAATLFGHYGDAATSEPLSGSARDEQGLCAPRILTGPRSCSPEAPALFASAPSPSAASGSLRSAQGTDKHAERTTSGAAEASEPWARTGARSLQAALAEHSLDAIVRILSNPPEQVRATRGIYDSELSVTGLGLRADVERVLGDRSAEVVAALLARAGVSTSDPLVHYVRQTERGGYEKNFSIRSSPRALPTASRQPSSPQPQRQTGSTPGRTTGPCPHSPA